MSRAWHETKKRSMWDGSITALCGARAKSGEYKESWFGGSSPGCPDCKRIKRKGR